MRPGTCTVSQYCTADFFSHYNCGFNLFSILYLRTAVVDRRLLHSVCAGHTNSRVDRVEILVQDFHLSLQATNTGVVSFATTGGEVCGLPSDVDLAGAFADHSLCVE
jgi:hypothetical protein